jgi:predicted HTH transcriptional regulator
VALYRVGPGFPRIVEDDLRPGLGAVRYLIDASACAPFEVAMDRVAAWLRDNPAPFDPTTAQESQHLEFKSAAWKSQNPSIPDKVINESIVKSVAALLNADGGILVIGVEDRTNAVIGIEPDLEHLGVDLDAYENRLTTLLITSLGSAATTNARIEFEPREDRTVCLVTVRASPRPVFADSPVGRDKRNLFWVRMNNTTRELEGQDLVDYIREHWG